MNGFTCGHCDDYLSGVPQMLKDWPDEESLIKEGFKCPICESIEKGEIEVPSYPSSFLMSRAVSGDERNLKGIAAFFPTEKGFAVKCSWDGGKTWDGIHFPNDKEEKA